MVRAGSIDGVNTARFLHSFGSHDEKANQRSAPTERGEKSRVLIRGFLPADETRSKDVKKASNEYLRKVTITCDFECCQYKLSLGFEPQQRDTQPSPLRSQ